MKRLHAFNNAALVLAAAIASAFAPIVTDAIKPRLGTGPAVLLVFTGVLIGLFLVQWLVGTIVSKSQFLRRLLLGHSFVEGYWVDISRDPRNRVTGAACVYIFYEDDQLKIDGTTLKANDGMYGTWGVRFAMFQDHTLAYAFESHTNRSESPYETGYAQLKFSHSGKAPTSYSGFFFDTTNKKLITLEGTRVADATTSQRLDQPDERKRFLAELLAKHSKPIDAGGIEAKENRK